MKNVSMSSTLSSALAVVAVLTGAIGASAQSTSTVASSSTTQSSAKSSMSRWSGLMSLQVDTDAYRKKTKDEESNSPLYDVDAESFSTITSLGATYKFETGHSLSVIQRIGYTQSINPDRQLPAGLSAIRFHYKMPMSLMGAEGSTTVRVAPAHTNYLANEINLLGTVALIPALQWGLTPKLSVSYSGFFGATFFKGPQKGLAGWQKLQVADSYRSGYSGAQTAALKKAKKNSVSELSTEEAQSIQAAAEEGGNNSAASKEASIYAKTGDERSYYAALNSVALGYQLTESVSVSQGVGYGYVSRNFTNTKYRAPADLPNTSSIWMEMNTGVSWAAAKGLSFDLGVGQQHPLLEGSSDPVSGKAIKARDGFSPYIAEQTTFSLTTAYRF